MSSEKIQVLCRVRPGSDKDRHEDDVLAWCDATNRVAPLLGADGAGSTRSFEFQNVLGPDQGNTEAFEAVRDVVDSALDGMNATVMAYGHTSSGKTHTMLGTPAEPGIIIRTVQHLLGGFAARGAVLDSADAAAAEAGDVDMEAPSTPTTPTTPSGRAPPTPKRKGEQAAPRAPKRAGGGGGAPRITASYFEVYMERVYDLLSADRREVEVVSGGDDAGAASGPVVQNLERRDLRALSDCVAMVSAGQETRRVARTNLNENSSRGHTVFQLELHLPQSRYAQVRLVDLAGSENAKAAGGGGLTAREGGAINKSLLALTNVIQSLAAAERPRGAGSSAASSSPYIPYRDAKLTRILQNSLGGNSKTRIICCVASKRAQFDETLATLLFSDRARTVKNTVRVNTVPPSVLAAAAAASSAPAAAAAAGENSPGSVAQFSSQAVKQSLAEAAGLAEEYKRAADDIAEAAKSLVASDAGGDGGGGSADELARRDDALVRDAVVPMMAHLLSEMKGEADLWRETEYLLQKKCYALTENFQKKLARHADQREAEVAKERERGREKLEAERARHAEEVARLTAAAAAGGGGGGNGDHAAAAAVAAAEASASASVAAEREQCRRQLRDAAAREDEARSRLAEAEAEVLRERSARAAAEAAAVSEAPPPAVVGVHSVSFESLYMKAKAEVKELKVKLTQVLTVQRTCTERMVEAKVVQISTRKSLKRSYSALQTEQSESCVVRSDQQIDVSMLDASAEAEHSSMAIDGSSSMFAGGPPPAMPAGMEGASFVAGGGGGGGGGGAPPLAVRGKKSRTPQHPARRMVPESTPPRSAATRTRTPGRAAPATPVSSRTPAGAATPKSTARVCFLLLSSSSSSYFNAVLFFPRVHTFFPPQSRTPTGGMRTPKATPASGTRTRTTHASPAQPVRPVNLFGASSKRTGSAPVPKRRKMKTPTPTAPARREETAWM